MPTTTDRNGFVEKGVDKISNVLADLACLNTKTLEPGLSAKWEEEKE
jgi:hypothetical protein